MRRVRCSSSPMTVTCINATLIRGLCLMPVFIGLELVVRLGHFSMSSSVNFHSSAAIEMSIHISIWYQNNVHLQVIGVNTTSGARMV